MITRIYNNASEIAISIWGEGQKKETRIDFSIFKETKELEIAVFDNGNSEPVQNILLPLLPGMAALDSFFSNPEVLKEIGL